ncbi:hypothetical protein KJ780_04770 [Candidatus Micrarchaeota archaeon]|nr:hypothetical protein [Candidatus Micrarchaeota archaeon]
MLTYRKGSRAERELIAYFSSNGYSVIRAAGSGVNSLSPDLLLFKRGNQYAIEAKAHETDNLGITREQFLGLKTWESNTGITTYVGWRKNREDWHFLPLSLFNENAKTFTMNWERAKMIGRRKEELI